MSISSSRAGVAITPITESRTPAVTASTMFVCIARRTRVLSPLPKYLAMTTPAPVDIPIKKLTSRKMRLPDELTASASIPSVLPTIRLSAVL